MKSICTFIFRLNLGFQYIVKSILQVLYTSISFRSLEPFYYKKGTIWQSLRSWNQFCNDDELFCL